MRPLVRLLAVIVIAAATLGGGAPARSDRASERATCTAAEIASYDLRFCMRSRALSRKQRLAVVAKALEHGRGAQAVDALDALRHGAFDDDKQVRQAIVRALAEAIASVPARAPLAAKLRTLLKKNSSDIRKLRADDCELHASEPQDRTAVVLMCRRFVGCVQCSERWARAELIASGKTLKLRSAKVSEESHGMCTDCSP